MTKIRDQLETKQTICFEHIFSPENYIYALLIRYQDEYNKKLDTN